MQTFRSFLVKFISKVVVLCILRCDNLLGLTSKVSFDTSFESKQPKLEPKLVLALSETKCLFRLFRFYTETECAANFLALLNLLKGKSRP
jgi:hypothetical protein